MTYEGRIREYYRKELQILRENQAVDLAVMIMNEAQGKEHIIGIPPEHTDPIHMFDWACKRVRDYLDWFLETHSKENQSWKAHDYKYISEYFDTQWVE